MTWEWTLCHYSLIVVAVGWMERSAQSRFLIFASFLGIPVLLGKLLYSNIFVLALRERAIASVFPGSFDSS